MNKILLASGVFGWDSTERRSNRYGSVHISDTPYDEGPTDEVFFDLDTIAKLKGERVNLTVEVITARESGHIGDLFLKVFPSTPDVGEVVDLGVGILDSANGYDGSPDIILKPNDGRRELWIDPRKLYRLHDQTVKVYAELTFADFTPAPVIEQVEEDGSLGGPDESIQVKNVPEGSKIHIEPKFKSMGEGLFLVTTRVEEGERLKVVKE